jgi:hypothetical protein
VRGKVVGDVVGLGLEGKGANVGLVEAGLVARGPRESNSGSDSSVLKWWSSDGLPGTSLRIGGGSC